MHDPTADGLTRMSSSQNDDDRVLEISFSHELKIGNGEHF